MTRDKTLQFLSYICIKVHYPAFGTITEYIKFLNEYIASLMQMFTFAFIIY
jgi:hypothetical protein